MQNLAELVRALSRPEAYPFAVEAVDVRQTHISVVFLAGEFAYKIKKPVALGFLDFSTLERRESYCQEEVRLNRRLAPRVYLGVVPVAEGPEGPVFEGPGSPIEWAVKMRRLPEECTLESLVERDLATEECVSMIAGRLAAFHRGAERGVHIARFGRFDAVSRNLLENLEIARGSARALGAGLLWERVWRGTRQALDDLHALIEERAARCVPCDTHGDLHLDHVYLFPDRAPPDDLVIVDCIEFNERFRYTDPAADVAFLAMDLKFHGRHDLAALFLEQWLKSVKDAQAAALLPMYTSYRAAVRAKVEGILCDEAEVPQQQREQARGRARAHWVLAASELEQPGARPCLLAVAGLPGTGKSSVARELARRAGCEVIRTDVVRKELAGIPASESARPAIGAGIYQPRAIDQTYAECLRRAADKVGQGGRVIVDATFGAERHRLMLLDTARACGARPVFLVCEAPPEVVQARLAARRGDASDADWSVYLQAAARFEPPSSRVGRCWHRVPTAGELESAVEAASAVLRGSGLA